MYSALVDVFFVPVLEVGYGVVSDLSDKGVRKSLLTLQYVGKSPISSYYFFCLNYNVRQPET
jgi:hypothetical protein